jgi:alanine racemase
VSARALSIQAPNRSVRLRQGGSDRGCDPWLEIDASALRHNAADVSRLVGGRPLLQVHLCSDTGMSREGIPYHRVDLD